MAQTASSWWSSAKSEAKDLKVRQRPWPGTAQFAQNKADAELTSATGKRCAPTIRLDFR